MSKLSEALNNPSNNPDNTAREVEGTFEDITFQLETIAEMDAVNFNVTKRVRKVIVELRKLGFDVSKSIKSGKK